MTMANGSIMIIGGEIGDNEAEEATLELLPATGVPDPTTTSGYVLFPTNTLLSFLRAPELEDVTGDETQGLLA
jgi:hypothetical protein